MSYDYATERPFVFTEDGQLMLLRIRDQAQSLIKLSGAATLMYITAGITGDSWLMMACVDRLVEIGELMEVPNPKSSWAQHRIFIARKTG